MRYRRVLQRLYKAKKRLIRTIRHPGYWKGRNYSNSAYFKKQYVSKNKKNQQLPLPSRGIAIQVESACNWVVQKTKWKVRLQRV